MKKIFCLSYLLLLFFCKNCFAETFATRLPIRSITSSTHGPSRVPDRNNEVLTALYNDETLELTLHYTIPGQNAIYKLYNEDRDVIMIGEGTMGDDGNLTFRINESDIDFFIIEVQIGLFIFEGEFDL